MDGIELVMDVMSGTQSSDPRELTVVDDRLFFVANDGVSGDELWVTHSSTGETRRVIDFASGFRNSTINQLTAHEGKLYFADGDVELWGSDGMEIGTRLLKRFDGRVGQLQSTMHGLFFRANELSTGTELWVTDGTSAGTVRLTNADFGPGSSLIGPVTTTPFGGVFTAYDSANGLELWSTNAQSSTGLRLNLRPGNLSSLPRLITTSGTRVFFFADLGPGLHESHLYVHDTDGVRPVPIARVIASHPTLTVVEDSVPQSYTIQLSTPPIWPVTIDLDAPGLVLSSSQLIFNSTNWNVPQTVQVSVVNNDNVDVTKTLKITHRVSSQDIVYQELQMEDVIVQAFDDDLAGVLVMPLGIMQTSESGATTSLQVILRSEPSHPVTFTLGVTDPSEAAFTQSSITFTPMNWNIPQYLTVRGMDDNARDGDVVYRVRLVDAVSLDSNYLGVTSDSLTLTNLDDEPLPQIVVSSPSIVEGDSGTHQLIFEVSLSHASSTPVTVQYATADGTATIANNDYIARSGTLTFSPGTSLRRFVAIDVVSDLTAELDETLLLNLSDPMAAILSTGQSLGFILTDDNAIEVRLPNQFFQEISALR